MLLHIILTRLRLLLHGLVACLAFVRPGRRASNGAVVMHEALTKTACAPRSNGIIALCSPEREMARCSASLAAERSLSVRSPTSRRCKAAALCQRINSTSARVQAERTSAKMRGDLHPRLHLAGSRRGSDPRGEAAPALCPGRCHAPQSRLPPAAPPTQRKEVARSLGAPGYACARSAAAAPLHPAPS